MLIKISYVIIVFFFSLGVFGCKNPAAPPPDEPENQAPSASFETGDFRISGAGTVDANGVYAEAGTLNGKPYYAQVGGNYKIFVNTYTNSTPNPFPPGTYWAVDTDETTGTTSADFLTLDYAMQDVGTTENWLPEDGTWYRVAGTNPVLTVAGIPFTVGSDNGDAAGEVVSISYTYSDPDGDSEGATEIRWYRCDTADALITDVNSVEVSSGSLDYTIQADDMNKFLKVQIIPVDDQGNIGNAAVSKAYMRLDTSS